MNTSFKKEPTLKVLALCIITVGAYLMYKLFELSKGMEQDSTRISKPFIVNTIVLFCFSMASLVWGVMHLPDTEILRAHLPIHVVSSIFDVIWIMKVRHKLNAVFGAQKGQAMWLNPLLTSVFHVVYFQHMINKYAEKE
jgi:peptidoglycan biosynthesis protein MviN/MurJ (putative lipid II flippase)